MNKKDLKNLLKLVKQGDIEIDKAVHKLSSLSSETIQDACIDHQRRLRTGIPEVIYGASKTVKQIGNIAETMYKKGSPILVTRVSNKKAVKLTQKHPWLTFHKKASLLTGNLHQEKSGCGTIAVLCAGTSDISVAEEAAITAESLGHSVVRIYDVGVAGLHRLLSHQQKLQEAQVAIVVAGMEGALPSVVAGLISCPVIAVPTSVGYGANFGGVSALLGMLNSCAPGLAVVNIDNGFGAACMAMAINQKR